MADKAMLWRELVQRHQLTEPDYRAVAGWRFADFVFSWDYDMFADGSKARRFGFHQFVETEAMFSRCSMSSAAVASFPECGIGFPAAQAAGTASERQHDLADVLAGLHQRMRGGGLLEREGFKICGFRTPRSSSGQTFSCRSAAICALSATLRERSVEPVWVRRFNSSGIRLSSLPRHFACRFVRCDLPSPRPDSSWPHSRRRSDRRSRRRLCRRWRLWCVRQNLRCGS